MSATTLFASLALLYGIATADPAVFVANGADAVPTGLAAAPIGFPVSLAHLDNALRITTPAARPAVCWGNVAGGAALMRSELFAPSMQQFDILLGVAASQDNGPGDSKSATQRTGAFKPAAAGIAADISFSFGAELYDTDPDPVSGVASPITPAMMSLGFAGVGFIPYLAAKALLSQTIRSAFAGQSKEPPARP